jgi:hypothetical protein
MTPVDGVDGWNTWSGANNLSGDDTIIFVIGGLSANNPVVGGSVVTNGVAYGGGLLTALYTGWGMYAVSASGWLMMGGNVIDHTGMVLFEDGYNVVDIWEGSYGWSIAVDVGRNLPSNILTSQGLA